MAPVISTTLVRGATSVVLFWTEGSERLDLTLLQYEVSLSRRRGVDRQRLCPHFEDNTVKVTAADVTSATIGDLQEFSTYTVTVTAVYDAFGLSPTVPASLEFDTLSAGKPCVYSVLVNAIVKL